MKHLETLIASAFTLAILMYIAFLLGKSLESFIPPIIVWLLLAVAGMKACTSTHSASKLMSPPPKPSKTYWILQILGWIAYGSIGYATNVRFNAGVPALSVAAIAFSGSAILFLATPSSVPPFALFCLVLMRSCMGPNMEARMQSMSGGGVPGVAQMMQSMGMGMGGRQVD